MPNDNTANSVAQDEPTETHPIQALLNQSYGKTWANRRRRSVDEPIRVDDQKESDVDGMLPKLTVLTADHDEEDFTLELDDSILVALEVSHLKQWNGRIVTCGHQWSCRFHLYLSQLNSIRSMAEAVETAIAPGQGYVDRNRRWICPRTADALYRLADELEELAPDQDYSGYFEH